MRARSHAIRPLVATPARSVARSRPSLLLCHHQQPWKGGSGHALLNSVSQRSFCLGVSSSSVDFPRIATSLADIPNPKENVGLKSNWISDAHGYVTAARKGAINGIIDEIHAKHGVEVAVVIIDACSVEARPFLKHLFNEWGIGCPKQSNGVMLAVIMGKRRFEIVTGDGLDVTALDKEWLEEMQEDKMVPASNESGMDAGLVAAVEEISKKLNEWEPPSEDPNQTFTADWVRQGETNSGRAFGGGLSSTERDGTRWMAPEKAITGMLVLTGVACLALYIEDKVFEREQKRCPECGEWKLERYVETVKAMTCDPPNDGSVCHHTVCRACGYHHKKLRVVKADHRWNTVVTRLKEPTNKAEGLERVVSTCQVCGAVESFERLVPIRVARRQHAGI